MAETTINPHWLHNGTMWMVYASLNAGLMESYHIFATTANIANIRNKATDKMQLTKIRWDDALNVEKSTANE